MLTFNPENRAFIYHARADEEKYLNDLGLTRSLARPETFMFYTSDYVGKPRFNPYAVLPLADRADARASAALAPYMADYRASFATESGFTLPEPPCGRPYHPFQLAGIEYALARKNAIIGDEMGLGKTVQALGMAVALNAKRVLVVCPASVRLQWRAMAQSWLRPLPHEGKKSTVHVMASGRHGVHPHARVVVVSFDLVRSPAVRLALHAVSWDLCVIDEAHYVKNHDAARTVALLGSYDGKQEGIQDIAAHTVALTGTPLPNRPRECYTITRALCWDALDFMSEEKFQFRFNPSHVKVIIDQATGKEKRLVLEKTGRLLELQARLRSQVMVRRLKRDVLKDLPTKTYELLYAEDTKIRMAVDAERMLQLDVDYDVDQPAGIDGHIAEVRHQMGLAMVPHAIEHAKRILEETDKLVIFCHHRDVMLALYEGLRRYDPTGISGITSPVKRVEAVRKFMQQPSCRVFLGQLVAAGTGVDGLQTVCYNVLFAEPSWTPGENEQCVDRLDRMGQTMPVLAQFLVAPGSLLERIIARAVEKLQTTHVVLDARVGSV